MDMCGVRYCFWCSDDYCKKKIIKRRERGGKDKVEEKFTEEKRIEKGREETVKGS